MYIPAPNESNFTPVPAGTHLGICYRVIDLGTQVSTYSGEQKTAHKIMLTWELPDERMDDGRPYSISQTFTWSMHEKATLRKSLEAWRGVAFTDADFGPTGFDIRNLLSKACTLSVIHKDVDGKTFANIASIGKVMKGVQVPPLTNKTVYLWINAERWQPAVFNELSTNLQGKIMGSPEYIEMRNQMDGGQQEQVGHAHADEDIPF